MQGFYYRQERANDKGTAEEVTRELMGEKMLSNQLLGDVKTKQATSWRQSARWWHEAVSTRSRLGQWARGMERESLPAGLAVERFSAFPCLRLF